jgi:hypothetical protein
LRVSGAVVAALLLVILVGGVTEALAGNDLAQGVRKTILIGSTLLIAAWVAGGWQAMRSSRGP